MDRTNVEKMEPIAPPPPAPPAPPPGSNANSAAPPPPKPAPAYGINNLPLGAKALSTEILVRGPYINVHNFIWRLNNFRYSQRAININSITINDWNEQKKTVSAQMKITRFVRPEKTAPGSAISTPGAPGGTTNASGTSTPSSDTGNAPSDNAPLFKGVKKADPGALLHPPGR
jgi:hypothetical protein